MVLIHSELCKHHHQFQNISLLQKETPHPTVASPHSPLLWQPLVYFLCLQIRLLWTFCINGITYYVTSCIWLLSFSMFPRFTYIVACVNTSFLFIAKDYSTVWIYQVLFIHLSIDGHLVCFLFWAIINNACANIYVQVVWIYT